MSMKNLFHGFTHYVSRRMPEHILTVFVFEIEELNRGVSFKRSLKIPELAIYSRYDDTLSCFLTKKNYIKTKRVWNKLEQYITLYLLNISGNINRTCLPSLAFNSGSIWKCNFNWRARLRSNKLIVFLLKLLPQIFSVSYELRWRGIFGLRKSIGKTTNSWILLTKFIKVRNAIL